MVHLLLHPRRHGLIGVHGEHGASGGVQAIKAAPHLQQLVAAADEAECVAPVLLAEQRGGSTEADDSHLNQSKSQQTAASYSPTAKVELVVLLGTGRSRLLGPWVLNEESLSLPSACLGKWQRERQDEREREREREEEEEEGSPGEEKKGVWVFYSGVWF